MKSTIRIVALIGAILIVAGFGIALAADGGSLPPVVTIAPSDGPTPEPTPSPSRGGRDDVKGNCDEAEHAADPRCLGTAQEPEDHGTSPTAAPTPSPSDDRGDDISGNCDEAEHAGDPECQGVGATDDSGHGSDDSGHGSDDSGHGSDNSGHGSDNSGHDDHGGDD